MEIVTQTISPLREPYSMRTSFDMFKAGFLDTEKKREIKAYILRIWMTSQILSIFISGDN